MSHQLRTQKISLQDIWQVYNETKAPILKTEQAGPFIADKTCSVCFAIKETYLPAQSFLERAFHWCITHWSVRTIAARHPRKSGVEDASANKRHRIEGRKVLIFLFFLLAHIKLI